MTQRTENCGNCKFYAIEASDVTQGTCHRFPPTLFVLPMQSATRGIEVQIKAFPPPTGKANWCGEHTPRIELE